MPSTTPLTRELTWHASTTNSLRQGWFSTDDAMRSTTEGVIDCMGRHTQVYTIAWHAEQCNTATDYQQFMHFIHDADSNSLRYSYNAFLWVQLPSDYTTSSILSKGSEETHCHLSAAKTSTFDRSQETPPKGQRELDLQRGMRTYRAIIATCMHLTCTGTMKICMMHLRQMAKMETAQIYTWLATCTVYTNINYIAMAMN